VEGKELLDSFGPAASFSGSVDVTGDFSATAKSFVIDHPLDPAGKYLAHASIESSEQANVYSGNIVLDDNGEAVMNLPAWVEAINEDFRYQLTCVGRPAPVYVVDEFSGNQFRIAGAHAGLKVSWQLTGAMPWALGIWVVWAAGADLLVFGYGG
jgi:trimeric autotransporter adhesin